MRNTLVCLRTCYFCEHSLALELEGAGPAALTTGMFFLGTQPLVGEGRNQKCVSLFPLTPQMFLSVLSSFWALCSRRLAHTVAAAHTVSLSEMGQFTFGPSHLNLGWMAMRRRKRMMGRKEPVCRGHSKQWPGIRGLSNTPSHAHPPCVWRLFIRLYKHKNIR